MLIPIVTRPAMAAVAVVIAWTATPRAGLAQQCRRTCETGEIRDVHGCCVPNAAPAPRPARPEPRPERTPRRERPARESREAPKSEAPVTKPTESTTTGKSETETTTSPPGERPAPPTSGSRKPPTSPLDKSISLPDYSAARPEPEPNRRWPVWMPWAVVGVGAVATGAGGILYRSAAGQYDRFDEEFGTLCPGVTNGCTDSETPQGLADRLERARTLETVSRVSFIAGGVTMAAGVALVFLNQTMTPTDERATARTFVVPTLGPDAAGIAAGIAF